MNVLVVGSGGREHALAWGLKRSLRVKEVIVAPGNAGMSLDAELFALEPFTPKALTSLAKKRGVDMIVIGPEAPLVEGWADDLREKNLLVFGPGRAAAQLEGSKAFAKRFMQAHGLPTADAVVFEDFAAAEEFVHSSRWTPTFRVVKADGLAGGKGVVVCQTRGEVLSALNALMVDKIFGAAGERVIVEEMLEGEEVSVLAFFDGETLLTLPPVQDHKRVFDEDQGPNTGGMGSYAPAVCMTQALQQTLAQDVFAPFVKGIKAEGLFYRGVIFFGLMLTPRGPRVLEFNVRFGDPETQVIVPLVLSDWYDLLRATAEGRLKEVKLSLRSGSAVCVVMASQGYPGPTTKGQPIQGLEALEQHKDLAVFHAGTARPDPSGPLVTAGGRVLGVTAWGQTLLEAREKVYQAVSTVHFQGAHFRRDIAARALPRAGVIR